jgi:hypothetical protein
VLKSNVYVKFLPEYPVNTFQERLVELKENSKPVQFSKKAGTTHWSRKTNAKKDDAFIVTSSDDDIAIKSRKLLKANSLPKKPIGKFKPMEVEPLPPKLIRSNSYTSSSVRDVNKIKTSNESCNEIIISTTELFAQSSLGLPMVVHLKHLGFVVNERYDDDNANLYHPFIFHRIVTRKYEEALKMYIPLEQNELSVEPFVLFLVLEADIPSVLSCRNAFDSFLSSAKNKYSDKKIILHFVGIKSILKKQTTNVHRNFRKLVNSLGSEEAANVQPSLTLSPDVINDLLFDIKFDSSIAAVLYSEAESEAFAMTVDICRNIASIPYK